MYNKPSTGYEPPLVLYSSEIKNGDPEIGNHFKSTARAKGYWKTIENLLIVSERICIYCIVVSVILCLILVLWFK